MTLAFDSVRFRKMLFTNPWDAYNLLYQHFRRPLYNIAVRLTRDNHASHDIVHDTFLEIWKHQERLLEDHEKSVENYVAKVVRFKAIDYFNRRRHKDIDVIMANREFAADEDSLESLIAKELYEEFRKFINTLPPRQWQCLTMKIDRDMSLDEIAAELNISRKTVELSQDIAKKKLKRWAERYK